VADVVTGDAVVLEVSAAAFPSRMAARLIDMIAQIIAFVLVLIVIGSQTRLNQAAVTAILTVTVVLIIVGYPTIFETLSRGKTLGKLAMGLRVVADDGGPVRFRQALVRALAGIFEIWTIVLSPVALLTSMASAKGKRLGDMFAGTYVITERVPRRANLAPQFAFVPPPLAGWAVQLELSGLSDRDAEAAGSFLRRFYDLQPAARDALGLQLAATVAAKVSPPPPPGTPPAAFLAAVLAVRRDREYARLAGQQPAWAGNSGPPPLTAPPPAAAGQPADQPPPASPPRPADTVPPADTLPPADTVPSADPAEASVPPWPGRLAPPR
jgi:uncharacterized RDD family membrane protein YckC